jgi:hypothetical protein
MRVIGGVFLAAVLALVPATAAAQAAGRTIEQYDMEAGALAVGVWENGGRWGKGAVIQGGYKVYERWGWHFQGVAELMVARFDAFDATYKQFVVGVRGGRMMWSKVRVFGQLQAGVQNDGFPNSSNGTVDIPGVGFNYPLTRRFDVQVLIDGPVAMFSRGTYNQARLGVGIGLPLGGN